MSLQTAAILTQQKNTSYKFLGAKTDEVSEQFRT